MRTLIYDLRFSLRQLRKTQGMTILAVLTLALGIGANAAIFTVIEDVILRPLPYRDADRLIFIGPETDKPGFNTTSWLNFHDIHEQSRLLENTAGYSEDLSVLETPDGSQSIAAPRVSTKLFSLLNGRPVGQDWRPITDHRGRDATIVPLSRADGILCREGSLASPAADP